MRPRLLVGLEDRRFLPPHLARCKTGDCGVVILRSVWKARDDRYSEVRSSQTPDLPKVEMSYVGG